MTEILLLRSLPKDKYLDLSKLKAFTDDKKKKWDIKTEILFWMGIKHCGKMRKFWLPAFSHFPTLSSDDFFLSDANSWDCVVKSEPITTQCHILTH